MSRTRGEVLARSIVTQLDAHQQLSEETLRRLISLIAATTVDIGGGIDQGLVDLEQDISSRFISSDASQYDGFSLGACWGSLEVLRAAAETAAEDSMLLRCVEVVRRHRMLFETVHNRPGIAQGQLAVVLGEKKSNFSQKLARIDKHQMLTVNIVGKSKHLYLTRRGEEALRRALIETGDRSASKPMTNTIVRKLHAEEIVYDENGNVYSFRSRLYVSMEGKDGTRNDAVTKGKRKLRVGSGDRSTLADCANAQGVDRLNNWNGHVEMQFGRAFY